MTRTIVASASDIYIAVETARLRAGITKGTLMERAGTCAQTYIRLKREDIKLRTLKRLLDVVGLTMEVVAR